jgi:hypothetical protein
MMIPVHRVEKVPTLEGATVLLETGSVWVDQTLVLDSLVNGALGSYVKT